jgi:peroxiredoxin
MSKKILTITMVIMMAIASVLFFYLNQNGLESTPNISLNSIDGQTIDINSMRGKPLLVTFWATTCSTCVKEMPHLVELYEEHNNEGFEIIAIAMSYDPPNRVVALSEKNNIPYPIALDIEGSAAKAFGDVKVTPTSFLIDPEGNIIHEKSGEINIEELRIKLKSLLKSNPNTVS